MANGPCSKPTERHPVAESRIEKAARMLARELGDSLYVPSQDDVYVPSKDDVLPHMEALIREAAKVCCTACNCGGTKIKELMSRQSPGHDCDCDAPAILEHFGLKGE